MIRAYHRPETLEEALKLIARSAPRTLPLGGGTVLSQPGTDSVEVVDLQGLALNGILKKGNDLEIGATATLQSLFESNDVPEALKDIIHREAPLNIRNMATAAGTIVACDGRSPFVNALLALDAKVTVEGGPQTKDGQRSTVHGLGEILPLRQESLRGKLITQITIPMQVKFAYEAVSRTPADKPILSAALAKWPSDRTRLVIGGFGASPTLAMDGTEAEGLEAAARNACHEAADEWASAEYRMGAAVTLAKRCLENDK
jgi:CO/xanthine dehydrogenase FAD-binding subunit